MADDFAFATLGYVGCKNTGGRAARATPTLVAGGRADRATPSRTTGIKMPVPPNAAPPVPSLAMPVRASQVLVPAVLIAVAAISQRSHAQSQPQRNSKLIQQSAIASPSVAPNSPASAAAAIADIPDDADLIIVVEHASELRASTIGDAVSRFLADAGLIADLNKAWSALADQLGLTRDEAFDRLLGQRLILVSKGASQGKARLWAILSDITVDTDAKLKDKLQAAPRAIDQGHQILTIENGEYQLTSHLRGVPAPANPNLAKSNRPTRPAPGDRVTLILGPSAKPELFDEMLAVVARGGCGVQVAGAARANAQAPPNTAPVGSISSHDVFQQAREAGPVEVLILAALDPSPGAPGAPAVQSDRWQNFVMLAGHRDAGAPANDIEKPQGATWRSRIVVRQTERRAELLKIEPTSDASFRALSDGSGGALIAMIQNTPLPGVLGAWAPSFTNILSIIPIPEDAKRQMSARQALCVRALPPNDRISCTIARGVPATEQLARTLDPEVSAGIQRIEKQFGVEALPPQDYAGLAPNAVRTTSLACSASGGMSIFTSRPLTVSWCYPSQVAVNGPANLADRAVRVAGCAVAPGQPPDRPGWWVLNISQNADLASPCAPAPPAPPAPPALAAAQVAPAPSSLPSHIPHSTYDIVSAAELLRSDANALLTTDPQSQTARWVWLAAARPAALEALLPNAFPDYSGIRSMLRRFEWFDLELQITDLGDIQGDLALRLTPAPK